MSAGPAPAPVRGLAANRRAALALLADRVALLQGGVIRWSGPVAQMDAAPEPRPQQFIHGRADGPVLARV